MLNLNDYQELSKRTMPHINHEHDLDLALANYSMGLTGESGEVVDHLKKVIFHGHDLDKEAVKKELGDVLHYVSGIATLLDIELDDVGRSNIIKLEKRYPNGFSEEASKNRSE